MAFSRTRSRHYNEAAVADGHVSDLNQAPLLLNFFADEFKGLQDRKGVFDSAGGFQALDMLFFVAGAYGGYDGSLRPANYVRRIAEVTNAFTDVVDLVLCRSGLHCYNHCWSPR